MYDNQPRDRLFSFRGTTVSKDKAQRDRLVLYLNTEDIQDMINILQANLTNPQGVKFDFHTGKKQNAQSGQSFDSTFGFVKAVVPRQQGGAQRQFAPRQQPQQALSPQTQAAAAQTLNTMIPDDNSGNGCPNV